MSKIVWILEICKTDFAFEVLPYKEDSNPLAKDYHGVS